MGRCAVVCMLLARVVGVADVVVVARRGSVAVSMVVAVAVAVVVGGRGRRLGRRLRVVGGLGGGLGELVLDLILLDVLLVGVGVLIDVSVGRVGVVVVGGGRLLLVVGGRRLGLGLVLEGIVRGAQVRARVVRLVHLLVVPVVVSSVVAVVLRGVRVGQPVHGLRRRRLLVGLVVLGRRQVDRGLRLGLRHRRLVRGVVLVDARLQGRVVIRRRVGLVHGCLLVLSRRVRGLRAVAVAKAGRVVVVVGGSRAVARAVAGSVAGARAVAVARRAVAVAAGSVTVAGPVRTVATVAGRAARAVVAARAAGVGLALVGDASRHLVVPLVSLGRDGRRSEKRAGRNANLREHSVSDQKVCLIMNTISRRH